MNYSPILTINTNQTDHIYVVGDFKKPRMLIVSEVTGSVQKTVSFP